MIGREVRVVRHALFLRGNVNVAFFRTALSRGHDRHVNAALYLREQNMPIIHPGQARRVRQHQLSFATEYRHYPCIPGRRHRVSDARAIRREHGRRFQGCIVCELKGFTMREQLEIEISAGHE